MFIIAIIELVAKYGIPGVLSIIKEWKVDRSSIDKEDIERLRKMVPKPDSYFVQTNYDGKEPNNEW
jgi:UDP-galactopyranose mutase